MLFFVIPQLLRVRPLQPSNYHVQIARTVVRGNRHIHNLRLEPIYNRNALLNSVFATQSCLGSNKNKKSFRWFSSAQASVTSGILANNDSQELPSSPSRPRSETRNRDVTKKKVAVIVGYDGAPYHGFQRNRDVVTVADALEQALFRSGAISDENFGSLEKIKWQVSARTDKGVCAAGNVISAKLQFNRNEYDSGDAFRLTTERVNNNLPSHMKLFGIHSVTGSFSARANCGERWYEYILPLEALPSGVCLEQFNNLLQTYEGTHSFHNFTIGVDHSIPPRKQAVRFITMARCETTPTRLPNSDREWVRIHIRGQSFVLHQIRKMISLALQTIHDRVPDDAIGRSFSRSLLLNIAPAPANCLFLDCCLFSGYNQRHAKNLDGPLMVSDFEEDRKKFKLDRILPSIAERIFVEKSLENYFNTVDAHPVCFD